MKDKKLLIITLILYLILPAIASYIRWDGFPPGYGLFPAQQVIEPKPFNSTLFTLAIILVSAITILFLFPSWFGFKKIKREKKKIKNNKTKYPVWFLPSLIICLLSWFFAWAPIEMFEIIAKFTFVPLWWSFIFVLDGLVYKRNNGVSLISSKPNTVVTLSVVSTFAWFMFEYLNFFVLENWYYPHAYLLSNFGNIVWQLVSYSTVLPAIFEWYLLLMTFDKLRFRYANGFKLKFSKNLQILILISGLALAFFMGIFPFLLYPALWLSLIPITAAAMSLSNRWTIFTPIVKGNWTSVFLIAMAAFFNAFFWEFWNHGSEAFRSVPANPNYWKYAISYLDKVHLFSEMPLVGYFGYLFFGMVCWLQWLLASYIFGFDPSINIFKSKDN